MFYFLTEAILSGGSDGSLYSESGESDDECDLSIGRFFAMICMAVVCYIYDVHLDYTVYFQIFAVHNFCGT